MNAKWICRAAVLCAVFAAAGAHAQVAGTWLIKGGVNRVDPQVKSGDLSQPSPPGAKVDVGSATSAILTFTYFAADSVSVEVFAGLPAKHDVYAGGALASVGKLGTTKLAAPTVMGQYRFLSHQSKLKPYVGLGLTYAYFYDEEGSDTLTALTNPGGPATEISVKAAWGPTAQLGLNYAITDRWFIDASVMKTWMKNTATLSTGQSIEARLDPIATNISIGYRF